MALLVPTGIPVTGVCTYVNSCVGTFVVPRLSTFVVSHLGEFVDSCSYLGLLDARSNLVRLDARPGLDGGKLFDGGYLFLGVAEGHLPGKPGGASRCWAP